MTLPHSPRVLVTRSAPGGQRLCREIERLGYLVVHCPAAVLIGPENPEVVRQAILNEPKPDGVIVTSPAGLVEASNLLGTPWFNRQPLVVPGQSTADRARALGIAEVHSPPGAGDSEAMLALPQLRRVFGQQWLVLAADGGRRLLERVLSERGARVTRHHVYQRLPAPLTESAANAIERHDPLVILLASAGALAWMQTMVDRKTWARLAEQPVIAPSNRVAALARQAGCRHVVQASGADDAAMLQALVEVLSRGSFG